jgi:hypothetical protein
VRRVLGLFVVGLAFAAQGLLQPGIVSAFSGTETGLVGHYGLTDLYASPGSTCKYGKQVPPNGAWFKWMTVTAPNVYAADRNSGVRDHRKVSWQFRIQVVPFSGGSWKTVAHSSIQRATAYDDQAAPFTPMKVYWKPSRTGPNAGALKVRAMVIIKWYKPGGGIEGKVKGTIDYYLMKMPWGNFTSSQPYCQDYTTSG